MSVSMELLKKNIEAFKATKDKVLGQLQQTIGAITVLEQLMLQSGEEKPQSNEDELPPQSEGKA